MEIQEASQKVAAVCEVYAKKFDIQRDDDWYLLKLQEELGELTQQHLKLTKRGRLSEELAGHREQLADELADVLATCLLYARNNDIDVEKALEKKWFRWL